MNQRPVIRLSASIIALISLFIVISASIQYFSAKHIQSHSRYTTGAVTKLYIRTESTPTKTGTYYTYHYQVQYTFSPVASTAKYHSDQGVSKVDYDRLSVGGPINVYYDTQKPEVQSIAGYQSTTGGLATIALSAGFIFLCAAFVTARLKNR